MPEVSILRSNVLREAARLFGEYGYSGTSLNAVAGAPDIREYAGDLFDSSEELAREAFDFAVSATNSVIEEALSVHENEVDQLLTMVHAFVELAERPPIDGGCPVFHAQLLGRGGLPFVPERTRDAVSQWRLLVRRIVRNGIRAGSIHPATNPETVGSIIVSTVLGAVLLYQLYVDPAHLERSAAYLSQYIDLVVRFH